MPLYDVSPWFVQKGPTADIPITVKKTIRVSLHFSYADRSGLYIIIDALLRRIPPTRFHAGKLIGLCGMAIHESPGPQELAHATPRAAAARFR